ncbi:MAG: CHAT domain-containing protein [Cyanobacteria bacterium J06623_7]
MSHPSLTQQNQQNYLTQISFKRLTLAMAIAAIGTISTGKLAIAQSITPNNDGTGTQVNSNGNTIDIDGGSLSGNGENLFHSFEQFGLSESQIANFMSNPNIRNILGRINGGEPSVINGLIQVTGGNSNLLLMNPAGIIFGESAQLNVPADFTATTATGIGFENNVWFNAVGENNYQTLVGTPNTFAFDTANPGAILNDGDLSLAEGKNLTLLGGNVINTGEVEAAEGSVTLSAVPGSSTVRIEQDGHLLSLEIEPPRDSEGNVLPFSATDLPSLLTSSGTTGLTANEDGSVTINATGTSFRPEAALAINAGELNVSGFEGGAVTITGNKVGILSGEINATGSSAGGNVRVGGEYQGGDNLPAATQTIVDEGSTISADAIETGNGGEVVVWSDSLTRFTGNITSRGGENGGDGGLVEVSGKDLLVFTGTVDAGELLLDPQNIIIGDEDTALASIFSPAPESEQADIAGFGIAVATVGDDLLVGSPANVSGGINNAGQAFLFDRSGNALRTYNNPEPVQGGFFGFSVAAVGSDELLIGAPRNSIAGESGAIPEAGQVFLFNKTASEPLETYDNPNPGAAFISEGTFTGAVPQADTNFGAALVAVDSDRFAVGAPGHRVTAEGTDFERSGQVFLLDRDGDTLQTFDNPNPTAAGNGKGTGNSFGIALDAIDTDRLAVGAPRNDGGVGQAFVFELDDSTPVATIDNPQADGNRFGQSVAGLDEDTVAVGAPRNSDGGQVYLYGLDDAEEPTLTLTNPDETGGDFGDAIAAAGSEGILVGARSNAGGVGQAYIFNISDAEVVETFDNPSSSGGGSFGTAVAAIDEDSVLIGASENDFRGLNNSGEAFVSVENTILDADSFTGALEFDSDPGATSVISPAILTEILDAGTDITLQASNNIIIQTNQPILTDNADGDGGNIILQAGRNVEINSDITSDNGNINIAANVPTSEGVVAEFRDPGIGTISIAEDVTLDAGTGNIALNVADGIGTRGNISANDLNGNNVTITTGIGTIDVAGEIDAAGDLELAADEIDLRGGADSVTANNISLSATAEQDINLGNQFNSGDLDLTTRDIAALNIPTDGDGQITVSSPDSNGTVTLFDSVADGGSNPFLVPVNIVGGDILVAPDLDFTWNIASGNLNNIFANGLTYSNFENYQGGTGNNIFVLGDADAAGIDGGAGNNTLIANDDNNTFNITDLDTGNLNEETEFANIQNLTGGAGDDTFAFIGDTPEISGNIDGGGGNNQLDYELFTGLDDETFIFDPDTGEATGINGTFTAIDDAVNIPNFVPEVIEQQVRNEVNNQSEEITARDREREIPTPRVGNVLLSRNADESTEVALLRRIDSSFTDDYEAYYGRNLDSNQQGASADLGVNLAEVQETLRTIEESTGAKPALIYAAFFPTGIDALQGRNSNILPQADDQLELVTITSSGKAIRKRIKGVTRADVERSARRLTAGVSELQPESQFMSDSQQLYQWLIEPLKEDLETQEISNLVFLMDSGLRSLPVAALHDGEQYLVQEYSVGLMPSLSLTDTRYQDIDDVDLLAMGSETFPADSNLVPLPGVPVEIELITEELWGGSSFQGSDFTIDNLKQTQSSQPFGILHLATHAEFNPGSPKNSYIQFGDRKLELDQVRELSLNNPQVELMVLSACKTAVGDYDAEFGFAGLAHQAGVKSALGSLWYISDQGTLSMMSKFYQELKEAPIKAEALRRAQVAMIEQQVRLERGKLITANQTFDLPENIEAINLTHPFFWSPYTIVGNPW